MFFTYETLLRQFLNHAHTAKFRFHRNVWRSKREVYMEAEAVLVKLNLKIFFENSLIFTYILFYSAWFFWKILHLHLHLHRYYSFNFQNSPQTLRHKKITNRKHGLPFNCTLYLLLITTSKWAKKYYFLFVNHYNMFRQYRKLFIVPSHSCRWFIFLY